MAGQYGRGRRTNAPIEQSTPGRDRGCARHSSDRGHLSAAAALETAYRKIHDTGSSLASRALVYSFAEMNRLMGLEDVLRFNQAHAES
jgi:hypothetical protein